MFVKKTLMVERKFISYTPLHSFNPNFQRIHNDLVEIVYDDKKRLCYRKIYDQNLGQVDEYIYYKENGEVDKIVSLKYDEDNFRLTFHSSFEYYDNKILKKTVLVKKESFFSLNKLGYTYDGLNILFDSAVEKNSIINTEILSQEQLKNYILDDIPFYNELKYDNFLYNENEEIIESNEALILTRTKELSKNGHFIFYDKKYGNRPYNKGLLLEKKLHVALNKNSEKIDDLDYFREISGIEYYGYSNNQLIYIENPFYSLAININPVVGNIKLEQGILVDRERLNVSRLYSIQEEELKIF